MMAAVYQGNRVTIYRDGDNTPWSGTFSIPRELSMPEDGVLRIRPIRELNRLRYNETAENGIRVAAGTDYCLCTAVLRFP